jgi:ABC-type transport system involved in multi-copper enzyme maturation permease subunit
VNCRQIHLSSRGVLLELWRRQDAWILLLLMLVFSLIAIGARLTGIHTPAAGTFMLNLGITLAGFFAHLLTILIAVRQFPDEIENRTLYPLLAKPIQRDTLVLGKWFACSLGGLGVFVLFFLIAWFASPHLETYKTTTLLQHLALQSFSIAAAAALALAAGLALPRGLSLTTTLALVFFGERLFQFLVTRSPLAHLLPRFGILNLATRYTDGVPAPAPVEFLALLLYALLWTTLGLTLTRSLFQRRPL